MYNKNILRLKKVIDYDGVTVYPQKLVNKKYWDFIYEKDRKPVKFYSIDQGNEYLLNYEKENYLV